MGGAQSIAASRVNLKVEPSILLNTGGVKGEIKYYFADFVPV